MRIDTTVLQAAEMRKLDSPAQADVAFLRSWLEGDGEGDGFLDEDEAFTWTPPLDHDRRDAKMLERDFFTLHTRNTEQDIFSQKLSSTLLDWWIMLRPYGRRICCNLPGRRKPKDAAGKSSFPYSGPSKVLDLEKGVLHYSEARLYRFNNILVSVLSSALPVLAIVALYFIRDTGRRIGAMAGFTILFALALAIFTNARRLEIFASTAA